MTWQPKYKPTSPEGSNWLRNTLKEYDKDNDGYINWNEFCDMAHDKQYNNYERDQLWIQLGAGKMPTKNSYIRKIPIQPIIQSSPTKQKGKKKFIRGCLFLDEMQSISHSRKLSNESRATRNSQGESYDDSIINNNKIKRSAVPKGYQSYHTIPDFNINANSAKNKGYHSDERIQRAHTSEKSMKAKQQLMDNPLIDYDLKFANMLHKIYNSDDIKDKEDNKQNEEEKEKEDNKQNKQKEKKDEKRGNNNNNINNNINIEVGNGGYRSYDTTFDRHNVCWEFNTFVGCRKGWKCKWEHKYLLKVAIHPHTGEKLNGMAVRKFRLSNNI